MSLKATGVVPGLAIDMMEVGESTGALPAMLGSVAEFYEDALNRWAVRTGRERPRHPLATEIMRRIRSLPLL